MIHASACDKIPRCNHFGAFTAITLLQASGDQAVDSDTIPETVALGAYSLGPPEAPSVFVPTGDIALTAMGMVSAVGVSAPQSFASVRARIIRARQDEDIYRCSPPDPDFEQREPAVMALIPYLGHDSVRERDPTAWFALLAVPALRELADDSTLGDKLADEAGLFVALPPPRPQWTVKGVRRFLSRLVCDSAVGPFRRTRVALGGRATALALFAESCAAIANGRMHSAVVLGVDSYLRTPWLAELDRAYKIKSERNFDGFIPAEAAACVLLEPSTRASQRQSRVWAKVQAIAHEKYAGTEADNNGEALARVTGACLPENGTSPLIVADLNGSTAKAREWGFAVSRLGDRVADVVTEYPAISLGDVGAASGLALALVAARYLATKYPDHQHALVWAASEAEDAGGDGLRASVLLSKLKS